MNPSTSGWILKYLSLIGGNNRDVLSSSSIGDYATVRKSGFIYGVSTIPLLNKKLSQYQLTADELNKINLFHLLFIACIQKNIDSLEATDAIFNFYLEIETKHKRKNRFFYKTKDKVSRLEDKLAERITTSKNIFKRDVTGLLTHAFLYIDVLAFGIFLKNPKKSKKYSEDLERIVIHTCLLAIASKKRKTKYDKQLLELFEESAAFIDHQQANQRVLDYLDDFQFTEKEKHYLLDLSCIAVWNDGKIDESERQFLENLLQKLQLSERSLADTISALTHFVSENRAAIKLFDFSNPISQVYKQATGTVKTLILRNKTRLITELEESGELLILLSKSTTRDLNKDEKRKVKEQLLDICKTIPSLTIFLLPGGSILLPILVKLIPQLLPSAFDDNRISN